jgi:hypothetical protein
MRIVTNSLITFMDRRWHSSIPDVLSFRVADCSTDHCMEVVNVEENYAVNKQSAQKFDG